MGSERAAQPVRPRPDTAPSRLGAAHIGLGRTLDGTRIILFINGYDVRVIHATTGEFIRTLTVNPERRYHGAGRPPGGPKGPRKTSKTGP